MRCSPCINKCHYSLKGQTEMSGNAFSCIFKDLCATWGLCQLFIFRTFYKEGISKKKILYVCMCSFSKWAWKLWSCRGFRRWIWAWLSTLTNNRRQKVKKRLEESSKSKSPSRYWAAQETDEVQTGRTYSGSGWKKSQVLHDNCGGQCGTARDPPNQVKIETKLDYICHPVSDFHFLFR